MPKVIQPAFSAGVISPEAAARVDVNKYHVGLAEGINGYIRKTGGFFKRPGFQHRGLAKSNTKVRNIPFEFNSDQTYALEFTEECIRIWENGNLILGDPTDLGGAFTSADTRSTGAVYKWTLASGSTYYLEAAAGGDPGLSGKPATVHYSDATWLERVTGATDMSASQWYWGTGAGFPTVYVYAPGGVDPDSLGSAVTLLWPIEVVTPYQDADLSALYYAQSGDTLILTHRLYPPAEFVRGGQYIWTYTEAPINESYGLIPAVVGTTPGYATEYEYANSFVTLVSKECVADIVTVTLSTVVGAGNKIYVAPSTLVGGDTSGIEDVVAVTDFFIYRRSRIPLGPWGDWGFLYQSSDLKDYWESITDDLSATVAYILDAPGNQAAWYYTPGTRNPGAIPATLFDATWAVRMTNIVGSGTNADGLVPSSLEGKWLQIVDAYPAGGTFLSADIAFHALYNETFGGLAGNRVDGAGWTWTSATYEFFVVATFTDDDSPIPDTSDTPFVGGPSFTDAGNYPAVCTFYEQRLFLGGSDNSPAGIWGSRPGVTYNFAPNDPVTDDDPIEKIIYSRRVNRITGFLPLDSLLVSTQGSMHRIYSDTGIVSPLSLQAKLQSEDGYEAVQPIVVGGAGLFVKSGGRSVHAYGYTFQDNLYKPTDLTLLAEHYFQDDRIVDWCYQREPHSVIWCVMESGKLLSLVFIPDQEMIAWTEHDLDTRGQYSTLHTRSALSVCAVREGNTDACYIAVLDHDGDIIQVRLVTESDDLDYTFNYNRLADSVIYETPKVQISSVSSSLFYTAAPHGLSENQVIFVAGFGASKMPIGVNGRLYKVDVSTTTTFLLKDYFTDVTQIFSDLWDPAKEPVSWGLGWYQPVVTSVTGLNSFAGEQVWVVSNGVSSAPQGANGPGDTAMYYATVSAYGTVTLLVPASKVTIGRLYRSGCRLLNLDFAGGKYASSPIPKSIGKIYPLMRASVGVSATMKPSYEIGSPLLLTGTGLRAVRPSPRGVDGRFPSTVGDSYNKLTSTLTTTTKMVNGYGEVEPESFWSETGSVIFDQPYPLPMHLLHIIMDVAVGGDGDADDLAGVRRRSSTP